MSKLTLPPKAATPAPDQPTAAMTKLKISANRLNSLTDKAAATVRGLEHFLAIECSIGFNAFVEVTINPDTNSTIYLEYMRIGSQYRIAVVENDDEGIVLIQKAWSDCSRDIKMETIVKLPDLIQSISDKVESDVALAEAAEEGITKALSLFDGNEG